MLEKTKNKKQKVYKYAASLDLSIRSGLSSRVDAMLMVEKFCLRIYSRTLHTNSNVTGAMCIFTLNSMISEHSLAIYSEERDLSIC